MRRHKLPARRCYSDPIVGNHEVTIIAQQPRRRMKNSWNAYWGDGGYINVPWAFVTPNKSSNPNPSATTAADTRTSDATTMNGRQAR